MKVSQIINFYVDINKYSGPEQVCGVFYSWERQDCTVMNMPKSCQCGCWQEQTSWLPSSKISTQSVIHPMTRQGLPPCPIVDVAARRGLPACSSDSCVPLSTWEWVTFIGQFDQN